MLNGNGQLYFVCKQLTNAYFYFSQEARICGIHRTVHAGEVGTYEAVVDVSSPF